MQIPAGQTIALVGSTGAGKSTLAKLISRFYDPSNGSVSLDGVDLRAMHPKDLRRAIVMVTQEAYLFSGSVADNIALGNPSASRDEIVAAAKAVGAHEFIESLPHGYDTDVNKRGGRVSAGQRQLLSFARAFLADPVVLILDEATASLDIPSERLVQEGLHDPARRPHRDHHRAPPVDGRDRGPRARHGARPDRRGRHARRPHRAAPAASPSCTRPGAIRWCRWFRWSSLSRPASCGVALDRLVQPRVTPRLRRRLCLP